MALYELRKTQEYEISALLTTVTEEYDRISMHGVRNALLEQQSESLGLPIERMNITASASSEEYEAQLRDILTCYRNRGISFVVFGDIFLEDLRRYREGELSKLGMEGIFPLWKRDTAELAHTFIRLGFKAIVTCVDSHALDQRFVGRLFDEQFLAELPHTVDPCGENGEFHSFVYDGPIFERRIMHKKGDIILRNERFYYCDLMPAQER